MKTNSLSPKATVSLVLLLLFCLLFIATMRLLLGTIHTSPGVVWQALTNDPALDSGMRTIIRDFRLPRVVTAILAGAALGVAGLSMQTLFRNPLADPYVLGISSGATFGVAVLILAGSIGFIARAIPLSANSGASPVLAAALGAAGVFLVILAVSRAITNNMTLLILGMLTGYTTSGLVAILLHLSGPDEIHRFVTWMLGDFSSVNWQRMPYFSTAIAVGLIVTFLIAKPLNAQLLGENYARSMGVNVSLTRFAVIISASLLAGAVTAYCGPIGFLGIAIPHLARALFKTSDHRVLVPVVVLLGACLACLADLIAELPGLSQTLPLNAVTSIIGAPVVIIVIVRRRHLGGAF